MKRYIHDGHDKQEYIASIIEETLEFEWNTSNLDYKRMSEEERAAYRLRIINQTASGEYDRTIYPITRSKTNKGA